MAEVKTKTFKKGIHFDDKKYLTKDAEIEEMPLTKNGKIDRAALLARTKSL